MAPSSKHLLVRLNKYISESGYASRRKADELIEQGKILVNGLPVKELGKKIDPDMDEVRVKQGPLIRVSAEKVTVLLNKPKGYVCMKSDEVGNKTIYELLPKEHQSLLVALSLEKDSEGLVVLTSDHDKAAELQKSQLDMQFLLTARGQLSEAAQKQLQKGMFLREGKVSPMKVRVLNFDQEKGRTLMEVAVRGRRTEPVYNAFLVLKLPLKKIVRTKVGSYSIGNLPEGMWSTSSH